MTNPARIEFLLPLVLVACGGSFPLFGAVAAPHGTSANQQKMDIAFCKGQAVDQASNNGEQAEAFLFGSSARKKEMTLERNVFSGCMTTRGYTVIPVQTAKAGSPQPTNPT
ncbi:MAG: hypothetical protein WCA64_04635 [Gallionella sp.]